MRIQLNTPVCGESVSQRSDLKVFDKRHYCPDPDTAHTPRFLRVRWEERGGPTTPPTNVGARVFLRPPQTFLVRSQTNRVAKS